MLLLAIFLAACGGSETTTAIKTIETPAETAAPPPTKPTKIGQEQSTERAESAVQEVADAQGVSCAAYPPGSCRTEIRVSQADPTWAALYIGPQTGYEGRVQSDSASFHRSPEGMWTVVQVGNGGGCQVPEPVRSELHLGCH